MLIPADNIVQLQNWLALKLEPLTLADSATLAEYVVSLLKNDKDGEDLKSFCETELLDFLRDHTKPFIDELFDTLRGNFTFVSFNLLF